MYISWSKLGAGVVQDDEYPPSVVRDLEDTECAACLCAYRDNWCAMAAKGRPPHEGAPKWNPYLLPAEWFLLE